MSYLKNTEKVTIQPGLKQTFFNAFTLQIGNKELVKMRNADKIKDRDLLIAEFLFRYRFATLEQIYAYLGEDINKPNVKGRLEKLIKYRVVNKFTLSEFPLDDFPEDAYTVYCLDLGGQFLLKNYTNLDASNWFTSNNMKGSEIVDKTITVTDIYLRMRDTLGDYLVSFKADPEYFVNKKVFVPSVEIIMVDPSRTNDPKKPNGYKYFICEVFKEYDYPMTMREKAYKYEGLFMTNSWKKYFYDAPSAPPLLIFAEDDRLALDSAIAISEMTDIKAFRVSTIDRMQKPLYELGAFLKYVPEEKGLREVKATNFKVN